MTIKPYKGSDPYIFVSYAHKNMTAAMEIIAFLQRNGYRVWFDEGIDPGTEWDMTIASHINNCGCFVALISPEYIESDNCCDELNYARDKKRDSRLMIYLSEVDLPDGMAMRMNRIQAIFKYRYPTLADFYEKITETTLLNNCRADEIPDSDIPFIPNSAWQSTAAMHDYFSVQPLQPEFEPVAAPSDPIDISKRFIMGEIIGKGGYGRVYKGIDTLTGSSVTIQRYIDDGYSLAEIGILCNPKLRSAVLSFDHPGLCKCLAIDVNYMLGYAVIVKEFIDGATLAAKKHQYVSAPLTVKLRLLKQIAEALNYLHSQGICYGDLNPNNIMIRNNGDSCLFDYSDVNYEGAYYASKTIALNASEFSSREHNENGPYNCSMDIFAFGQLIVYLDIQRDLPAAARDSLSWLIWRTTQENSADRPASIMNVITHLTAIANG